MPNASSAMWRAPVQLENAVLRSEEHTSELQSQSNLVCRLLLEKKKKHTSHASLEHRPDSKDACTPAHKATTDEEAPDESSASRHYRTSVDLRVNEDCYSSSTLY